MKFFIKGCDFITAEKWAAAKEEYVAGNYTYKEIADKYGVSLSTVEHHASNENWVAEKKTRYVTVTGFLQEKILEEIAQNEIRELVKVEFNNRLVKEQVINQLLFRLNKLVEEFPENKGTRYEKRKTNKSSDGDFKDVECVEYNLIEITRVLTALERVEVARDTAEIQRHKVEYECW